MNAERLLALYSRVADASDGMTRLRRFILDLAVRGKIVTQCLEDESVLRHLAKVNGSIREVRIQSANVALGGVEAIPSSWAWLPLGAIVGQMDAGWSPQCEAHPRDSEEQWGVLKTTAVQQLVFDATQNKKLPHKLRPRPQFQTEVGDILVTRAGPKNRVGVSCVVDVPCPRLMISDKLIRFHPLGGNSSRYIALALNAGRTLQEIEQAKSGMAVMQMNISQDKLRSVLVPVPPVAEQRRIVAKVDELMTLCDQLEKARAERENKRDKLTAATLARLNTPNSATFRNDASFTLDNLQALTTRSDQIKQLRESILSLAVQGRLCEQNTVDEPASTLLAQIRSAKDTLGLPRVESDQRNENMPFDLPVGWVWTRIGEISSKTGSGSTPRGGKSAYTTVGVPFLRSQNVHNEGLHLTDVAYIDQQTHKKMAGTAVAPRDLLLNITGGSMGRCCHIPEEFGEANVSQHVAIIRCAVPAVSTFLHKLVLSPYFQAFIFNEQTGAGRGGLPKNRMDRIVVALPPLQEQERIVAKVDELMVLCDRLEARLASSDEARSLLLAALLIGVLQPAKENQSGSAVANLAS